MYDKKELKNKLAMEIISAGEEVFAGEQTIAHNLLAEDPNDTINIPVFIYAIAVKKFQEKRKFDQALKWLDYALVFREDYYQVYFRKGEIFHSRDLYSESIKCYSKGLELCEKGECSNSDGLTWGHLERALSYTQTNEYEEACKDLSFVKSNFSADDALDCYVSQYFNCGEILILERLSLLAQKDKKIGEILKNILKEKEKSVCAILIAVEKRSKGMDDEAEKELASIAEKMNSVYKEAIEELLDGNDFEQTIALKSLGKICNFLCEADQRVKKCADVMSFGLSREAACDNDKDEEPGIVDSTKEEWIKLYDYFFKRYSLNDGIGSDNMDYITNIMLNFGNMNEQGIQDSDIPSVVKKLLKDEHPQKMDDFIALLEELLED
ncbi:MAG: hypothetical protein PHW63_04890 [Alphaproteobacteria bacterium]|nr:hypothetical protein [Alphaproteobacteria bacterium]